MRPALVLVALVLLAGQAQAQLGGALGGGIGDPCAPGYDPDAGVAIVTKGLPDGGLEDVPAAICKDQRAPAHGVFLTVEEASKRAGERAGLRHENELLKQSLTKADTIPGWVWFVSCVGGVVVTAYVAAHHK